jgi:ribosome-associated protein
MHPEADDALAEEHANIADAAHAGNEYSEEDDRPSKSQRKRDSDALQDLGAALVALSSERLAKIEMSDRLRDAVREAQRLTKNEAKRRQRQYIGKLMRTEDPAPIRAALDAIAGVSAAENERMHRLERLRSQLLEDEPAALAEITAAHPGADIQHLRQLRRNAIKEKEQNRPPRAFREIFQVLKELAEKKVAEAAQNAQSTADTEITEERE